VLGDQNLKKIAHFDELSLVKEVQVSSIAPTEASCSCGQSRLVFGLGFAWQEYYGDAMALHDQLFTLNIPRSSPLYKVRSCCACFVKRRRT
jgi:hypothetical protein